jgi:NRPS condensation-like uncharacterized protein
MILYIMNKQTNQKREKIQMVLTFDDKEAFEQFLWHSIAGMPDVDICAVKEARKNKLVIQYIRSGDDDKWSDKNIFARLEEAKK